MKKQRSKKVNTLPSNNENIEKLRVRLRHLENDFALTRQEYEDATDKYLLALADMQRKNTELEELRRELEERVNVRTALLASANIALEAEMQKQLRAEKAARRHAEEITRAGKLISLGTLVAGVAHEINNPNNLIMLSVPMLKKWFNHLLGLLLEQGDAAQAGEIERIRRDFPRLLAGIEQGSCRIRDIVKDLREFARPDDALPEHPFVLNEQVAAAANLLGASLREQGRRLEVEYGRNLPPLKGHPGQVRQLVASLIKNACESLNTSADGWVRVSTSFDPARSEAVLKVADNGVGIELENLSRLCDPFFTTRREQGAMGLGLAVADAMVRVRGGRMTFDSEPGRGTVVTVRLPVPAQEKSGKGDASA